MVINLTDNKCHTNWIESLTNEWAFIIIIQFISVNEYTPIYQTHSSSEE